MSYQAYIYAPPGGFWSNWQPLGMVNGPRTMSVSWSIESGEGDANVSVRYFNVSNNEVEEILVYSGQVINIGPSIFTLQAKVRSISLLALGVSVTAE